MHKDLRTISAFVAGALVALAISQVSFVADATAQVGAGESKPVEVDESGAIPIYANYARVTSTPDEAIIDLGIHAGVGTQVSPIRIHHQVVMTYSTLKRLTKGLNATVEQYEATFGPIELDVNKRVRK